MNFSLPDQDGKNHSLSDYQGQWVLLYAFPKDDTPGCTTQACGIRDSWKKFSDANIAVLGISPDSATAHQKFIKKFNLPFPLLVDEDKKLLQKLGVWAEKSMYGKKYMGVLRTSFLFNPEGKLVQRMEKVKPETHAEEILEMVKN